MSSTESDPPAAPAADPALPPPSLAHPLRALRHRNFRLFITGQLVSLIGTWMQSVAQSWLVYRLTGSSLLLGTVGFCSQIPVFILAPLGGVVADRTSRHKVVVVTQALSMVLALVLAALTLTGRVQVSHVFVLAGLLGLVNAFDIPARQAFIPEMVGRDDLMNVIALNSSMFNGARIVGPAIAGAVVAIVGEGWCFFANGVSYIAVIVGLLMMRLPPRERAPRDTSPLADIAEGFGFALRTKPIRALLLLLAVVSMCGMPYAVLMPIFADRILHGGPGGLGLLMGATGIGALVGTLTLAARRGLTGLGTWVVGGCTLFGTSLVLFSMSRTFWLSALLLMPAGCGMMVQMASSNTLIQAMVPDRLRGRVMAVYSMMFMGMAPFGALLAGAMAERIGAPMTVAIGGGVCLVAATVFGVKLPALRPAARELVLAQQMAGGAPAEEVSEGVVPEERERGNR